MGRKNKFALMQNKKGKEEKTATAKQPKSAKPKKNAFTVKTTNSLQKAKHVNTKIKNVKGNAKNKPNRELLNKQMDSLHKDMVVKVAKPEPKKVNVSKTKASGAQAKEVADVLAKMDM